jgi:hypothetical protein
VANYSSQQDKGGDRRLEQNVTKHARCEVKDGKPITGSKPVPNFDSLATMTDQELAALTPEKIYCG